MTRTSPVLVTQAVCDEHMECLDVDEFKQPTEYKVNFDPSNCWVSERIPTGNGQTYLT